MREREIKRHQNDEDYDYEDYDVPYKKEKFSGDDSQSFRNSKSYWKSSMKRSRGASSRGRGFKSNGGTYRDRSNRDKHRDESPHDDRDEVSKHVDKEENKKSKFFSQIF